MPQNPLRLTINEAKTWYKPGPALSHADRVTLRFLKRYGAFVRRDMRQNIRRRKRVSRPGQGPTNQTGLLKGHIQYVVDLKGEQVWIYPLLFRGRSKDTPGLLEFGGKVQVKRPLVRYLKVKGNRRRGRRGRTARTGVQRFVIKPGMYDFDERPYARPAKAKNDLKVSGIWAYARNTR